MSEDYQNKRADEDRLCGGWRCRSRVYAAMSEIAENAQEGQLALALGTCLQVMRPAVRHGTRGWLSYLRGRRVPVNRGASGNRRVADRHAEAALACLHNAFNCGRDAD